MLEDLKFYFLNNTDEVRMALYILGAAVLLIAFNAFKDKLVKTGELLLEGIDEILAALVVLPVTVVVICLELIVNVLTVLLTICTGIITISILVVNLMKTLLQDLTTYIVKNYGEESK